MRQKIMIENNVNIEIMDVISDLPSLMLCINQLQA